MKTMNTKQFIDGLPYLVIGGGMLAVSFWLSVSYGVTLTEGQHTATMLSVVLSLALLELAKILGAFKGIDWKIRLTLTLLSLLAMNGYMNSVHYEKIHAQTISSEQYADKKARVNKLQAQADERVRYATLNVSELKAERQQLQAQFSQLISSEPAMPLTYAQYMNRDCSPKTDANGAPYTSRAAMYCKDWEGIKANHQAKAAAVSSRITDINTALDGHSEYQGFVQQVKEAEKEVSSMAVEGGGGLSVGAAYHGFGQIAEFLNTIFNGIPLIFGGEVGHAEGFTALGLVSVFTLLLTILMEYLGQQFMRKGGTALISVEGLEARIELATRYIDTPDEIFAKIAHDGAFAAATGQSRTANKYVGKDERRVWDAAFNAYVAQFGHGSELKINEVATHQNAGGATLSGSMDVARNINRNSPEWQHGYRDGSNGLRVSNPYKGEGKADYIDGYDQGVRDSFRVAQRLAAEQPAPQTAEAAPAPEAEASVPPVLWQNPAPHFLNYKIGHMDDGKEIITRLQHPHLLVAGASNMGKSNATVHIINQLIQQSTPQQVQFAMIDPKGADLYVYEKIPHLAHQVAENKEDSLALLFWVERERVRRQARIKAAGYRKLEDWLKVDPNAMPYLVVVIDEMAMLVNGNKESMELLTVLVSTGRSAGLRLICATQYPKAEVIPSQISINIGGRMAFRTQNAPQSRVIIAQDGAESLSKPGVCLFTTGSEVLKITVPECTDAHIDYVVSNAIAKYGHFVPPVEDIPAASGRKDNVVDFDEKKAATSSYRNEPDGRNNAEENSGTRMNTNVSATPVTEESAEGVAEHSDAVRNILPEDSAEHSGGSRNIPPEGLTDDDLDIAKVKACARKEAEEKGKSPKITTYKITQWLECGGSKAARLLKEMRERQSQQQAVNA